MHFQLSSIVHLMDDAEKVVSLFMTYNGSTHAVTFNHDSLSSPEAVKSTLVAAVSALIDAYVSTKD